LTFELLRPDLRSGKTSRETLMHSANPRVSEWGHDWSCSEKAEGQKAVDPDDDKSH
jgi:hypothetical protein